MHTILAPKHGTGRQNRPIQTNRRGRTIPVRPPHHILPGQPPAWQTSLGQGPLGHVSQPGLDALLRPTANPESSFCTSELSHFSQLCLREAPAFSRNLVTCSHLLHLYSNIGTTQSPTTGQFISTIIGTYSTFCTLYNSSQQFARCEPKKSHKHTNGGYSATSAGRSGHMANQSRRGSESA